MDDALNIWLTPFLLSLIVSTGIGLIIGLEREFRKTSEKDLFAGIRTFPLVAILGCIVAYMAGSLTTWLVAAVLFAFILFVGATYFIRSSAGHSGVTTEVSLIITFMLGVMTSLQLIKEALAVTVVTTTLLSLKGQFQSFVLKITQDELFAFIKFIILCLLLFPFLPNLDYGPDGLLNPREIGFIVVIISSLSFAAYLLIKFAGADKGVLLTAVLGGFFSSTAVTWIFSTRSNTSDAVHSRLYAAGIILASSIMFIRVALVSYIFNKEVFLALVVPFALMAATGMGFMFYVVGREKHAPVASPVELGNPIKLLNILGFAMLYVGIALIVFYAGKYFGNRGLILSGLISGMADVDAITINMSKLAGDTGGFDISVLVIVLAVISNTVVKVGISLAKGSYEIRKKVALGLSAVILAGVMYVLLSFV